jgi:hypothetical protein
MSTQFCDRYRERNVARPREMLALRGAAVDPTKWQRISSGPRLRGLLRRWAGAIIGLFARALREP